MPKSRRSAPENQPLQRTHFSNPVLLRLRHPFSAKVVKQTALSDLLVKMEYDRPLEANCAPVTQLDIFPPGK
jgi:hypothetical protein